MNRPVRERMSSNSLSLIGVPKAFHQKTIEDFDTYDLKSLSKVKEYITEYIESFPVNFQSNRGLFLYGSNGVGKTFIASVLVKEAYRRRYTARRTTFVDYINSYTRMWGSRGTEDKDLMEEEFYNSFKAVEFLVLEEVGKEIDSKIAAPIFEDCLRYREDKGLVTVICTNLELKDLTERYGASCASLLKGNTTPILIEGKDKRRDYYERR